MGSTEDAAAGDVQPASAAGMDETITEKIIDGLVGDAEEIALQHSKDGVVWIDIQHEPLRHAVADAVGAAFVAVQNFDKNSEEAARLTRLIGGKARRSRSTAPRRTHVLAAHLAARLAVNSDRIIPGKTPPLTDSQRMRGVSDYTQWWALCLALDTAGLTDVPDTDHSRIVERRFMNVLADLQRSNAEQRDAMVKTLVDYLGQLANPSEKISRYDDPLAPPGDAPHMLMRGWWSLTTLRSAVIILAVLLVVSAVLFVTNRRVGGQEAIASQNLPASVPQTFDAAVLQDASLQLFGYPENTLLDPGVQAVPNQPAQHPVVIDVGKTFILEIRLTKNPESTADFSENFFLGFWTTALIKPISERTTLIRPGEAEDDAPPLARYPDTLVTNLDPQIPTVYKIPVIATPQIETDRPPEEEYNCGFNTTQAINVFLASSSHTVPVVTTLPISVRRTERCA